HFWHWDTNMTVEELFPRVERLRQALKSGLGEQLYLALHAEEDAAEAYRTAPGGKEAVLQEFEFTLSNRLADRERFFKRLGLTHALQSGSQKEIVLALAVLRPFPHSWWKQRRAVLESA